MRCHANVVICIHLRILMTTESSKSHDVRLVLASDGCQ